MGSRHAVTVLGLPFASPLHHDQRSPGNEGGINGFWDASGFVNVYLAKELGGLAVFAEERFYGPFVVHWWV